MGCKFSFRFNVFLRSHLHQFLHFEDLSQSLHFSSLLYFMTKVRMGMLLVNHDTFSNLSDYLTKLVSKEPMP